MSILLSITNSSLYWFTPVEVYHIITSGHFISHYITGHCYRPGHNNQLCYNPIKTSSEGRMALILSPEFLPLFSMCGWGKMQTIHSYDILWCSGIARTLWTPGILPGVPYLTVTTSLIALFRMGYAKSLKGRHRDTWAYKKPPCTENHDHHTIGPMPKIPGSHLLSFLLSPLFTYIFFFFSFLLFQFLHPSGTPEEGPGHSATHMPPIATLHWYSLVVNGSMIVHVYWFY